MRKIAAKLTKIKIFLKIIFILTNEILYDIIKYQNDILEVIKWTNCFL